MCCALVELVAMLPCITKVLGLLSYLATWDHFYSIKHFEIQSLYEKRFISNV